MRAVLLTSLGPVIPQSRHLEPSTVPDPRPGPGDVVVAVSACGVCHTELDEIEGRTPPPSLPIILGHQAVGRVVEVGSGVTTPARGDRVGVGWIYSACGACASCQSGFENLCPGFRATGRDAHGGYAELMAVPAAFVHPIPDIFTDAEAAPLLCAGAIGYRSLRLAQLRPGGRLGLTGFGASAHLVLKMVRFRDPGTEVFVFARSPGEQAFARELGAAWAGDTAAAPPAPLDAIIDTTPAWTPVVHALGALAPGGRLVINAIRKEDGDKAVLSSLDYASHVWLEKTITSVANVTRRDIREFLDLAAGMRLKPEVREYPMDSAHAALVALKERTIRGATVLRISPAAARPE